MPPTGSRSVRSETQPRAWPLQTPKTGRSNSSPSSAPTPRHVSLAGPVARSCASSLARRSSSRMPAAYSATRSTRSFPTPSDRRTCDELGKGYVMDNSRIDILNSEFDTNGLRSGFIAVVGRPNVGKSTLVNRLVGQKVSITSPRPQTTRGPIRGVRNGPGYQAVFVDTPGSQKPRDTLRARMQQQVLDGLSESDVILFVLDAAQTTGGIGPGDRYVARLVAESGTPAIASLNKVDLLPNREEVLPIVEAVSELGDWREIFPISAAEGLNIEPL